MKKLDFFKAFLALAIFATSAFAQNIWDGTDDLDWYDPSISSFTITTAEQLAGLSEIVNGGETFANKTITLGADIMLNDTTNWQSWSAGTTYLIRWATIGSSDKKFAGTFNGNGYIIGGIYINKTADYQGLFGYLDTDGIIKDLGVIASYVNGYNNVGGLVGANNGTIENCYATGNSSGGGLVGANNGTIENCYATGNSSGGGLVLENNNGGTIENCYVTGNSSGGGLVIYNNGGTIENCYATGDVGSYSHYFYSSLYDSIAVAVAGGLVGINNNGTIENCYATGNSSASNSSGISSGNSGGLVGRNSGTITNCYATGNVSGYYSGGLVGGNSGTITNCYATGNVSGYYFGGLVGGNGINGSFDGTITNCYYDAQTSGKIDDDGRGVPKNTGQMKRQTTYINWDFTDIWTIDAEINGGYPYLRSLVPFVEVSDISGIPTSTTYNQTITLNGIVLPQTATNKTIVYSVVSGNATINGHNITFTAVGEVTIRATIADGKKTVDYTKDFTITVAAGTSISDVKKSGNGLGIIFEKTVVSDELKIVKIALPDGKDGKITKTVIYDNTGNVVFSGENAKVWDLRNKSGRIVANGTYLVIVEAKSGDKSYMYSAKVVVKR